MNTEDSKPHDQNTAQQSLAEKPQSESTAAPRPAGTIPPQQAFHEAMDLFQRGLHEQAEHPASYCLQHVENEAMLYDLSLAARRAGSKIALPLADKALRIAGPKGDYLLNLARLFLQQGALDKAEKLLNKKIEVEPDMADGHYELVLLAREREDWARAKQHASHVLAIDPSHAQAAELMSEASQQTGQYEAALDYARRALEKEPRNPARHYHLGHLYATFNQSEQARLQLRNTLSLSPWHTQAHYNLATMEKVDTSDLRIDMLRALTESPTRSVRDRKNAHFTLGNIHLNQHDYPAALHHFRLGNQLHEMELQSIKRFFDPQKAKAEFAQIRERFTPEFYANMPHRGSSDERPLFVLGLSRSGKTTIEQILSASPDIAAGHETQAYKRAVRSMSQASNNAPLLNELEHLTASHVKQAANDYLEVLSQIGGDAKKITDTNPANFTVIGMLPVLFPEARIIFCQRSKADIALSMFFKKYHLRGPRYAANLEHIVHYINEYDKVFQFLKDIMPVRIHEVRYEDLLHAPTDTIDALFEFCESPNRDAPLSKANELISLYLDAERGFPECRPDFSHVIFPHLDANEKSLVETLNQS